MAREYPRVLVIDSEKAPYRTAVLALRGRCAVLIAHSVEVARRMATQRPPAVILIGDNMGDPEEVVAALGAQGQGVPVLILGASCSLRWQALSKPLDPEQLRGALGPLVTSGATRRSRPL